MIQYGLDWALKMTLVTSIYMGNRLLLPRAWKKLRSVLALHCSPVHIQKGMYLLKKNTRMATTDTSRNTSLLQAIHLRFLAQCHDHWDLRTVLELQRLCPEMNIGIGDCDSDGGEDDVSVWWLFDANYWKYQAEFHGIDKTRTKSHLII